MSFLCHLGRGGKSGANGPDGFVGNGDLGPVLQRKGLGKRLQLLGTDLHSNATLTLSLLLTDAEHDLETVVDGNLGLFGAEVVGLATHAESLATFGVSNDDPSTSNVLQLVRSNLTSEGTTRTEVATVLSTDFNVVTKRGKDHGDVDVGNTQNHIDVGRDRSRVVEGLNTLLVLCHEAIALPVASNEVPAISFLSSGRGRSLGAAATERRL
mmetsp:Transcript_6682/g.11669  ORF Transcript_6682/g.11669 Transcript_6682/m.11669 type:complete len:211 (+) Transcript_6682:407-1039(+)